MVRQHRLFVLDSSVLMHDPAAIFRFQEHDIYIPMMVLEELDAAKKRSFRGFSQRPPSQPIF
jgi:PhoH-like ATPase